MKMKNIVLLTALATSTLFAQSGKVLFTNHCSSCHATIVGINESGGELTNVYEAPYAKDVIAKLKAETKTKAEFVAFIKDYINKPDKRKSLYGKKAIKSFGLMPSLKGAMSDSESTKLANYLYSDYDKDIVTTAKSSKKSVKTISRGEKLFIYNCSSCHTTVIGVNESGGELTNVYEAPHAKDVVNKLKTETKTKTEFIKFVKNYIENPDKRKSLYGKRAIKDFGLMPSLKGAMSDSESTELADYLYHKYDK
ncbi:MAG: hypothetical protein DRG78_21970 [Epsilonproteobacteria bacterium]|nr:MAG: hypothetical protein DRG78_21970 [Campylobacterota bacterium]